jgi:transcriptional regulator with XRE-family HTH domain
MVNVYAIMKDNQPSSLAMELRKQAGLTQRQVAETLGVTVTTVARWESGARPPLIYLDQVKALLDLYQCSIDDLVRAFATKSGYKNTTIENSQDKAIQAS